MVTTRLSTIRFQPMPNFGWPSLSDLLRAKQALLARWPRAGQSDRHAAHASRFDHDRDISGESLASLLDLLDRQRLKASWGFPRAPGPG